MNSSFVIQLCNHLHMQFVNYNSLASFPGFNSSFCHLQYEKRENLSCDTHSRDKKIDTRWAVPDISREWYNRKKHGSCEQTATAQMAFGWQQMPP